ncbi:hypothetical protein G9A89_010773 [Geosiphon pyriformis]|nr:hypothetical protein G9A89_010773 [Geosiphon pyriformis]
MAFFTAGFSFLGGVRLLSVLESSKFRCIGSSLLNVMVNGLFVYMDGSLMNLGNTNIRAGAVVFFKNMNLDLGVKISDLLSSTLVKLQAIVLALEFKSHSDVLGNEHADILADAVSLSPWYLSSILKKHYILADDNAISEVGSESWALDNSLHLDVDWSCSFLVWHLNSHMAASFTSRLTAGA